MFNNMKLFVVIGALDGEILDNIRTFYQRGDAIFYASKEIGKHLKQGWSMDFNSDNMTFLVIDKENQLRAYYKIVAVEVK